MRGRLAVLALAGAVGCDPGEEAAPWRAVRHLPPPANASSLLLVSLDTFRGDVFGAGGDPVSRTPHLDRLARTGVQFESGVAPTPLTLPSHASLLTGRNPPGHGVHDNGTFRLPADVPTVAETLRARGFSTGAFVAAFPLDSRFGLDRGFDVYDDRTGERGHLGAFAMDQRDADAVADAAAAWLRSLPPERRVFLLAHLFEAHTPWTAPATVRRALGGDGYRADVAQADRGLGRLVRMSRESGDFWVVVLGDHGESLGEHGEANHGVFIHDATIRVPAVVWPAPPGEAAGLRRAEMRLVDFAQTAWTLLGLGPQEGFGDGRSAFRPGAEPAYVESLFPLLHYGWAPLRGVREAEWKYIDGKDPELYHLPSDPAEQKNRAVELPERVAAMRRILDRWTDRSVAGERMVPDARARSALKALGYAGGAEEALRVDAPDPRTMVRVQQSVERAQALLAARDPEGALGALRSALARDPDNKEVHHLTGLAHAMAGRNARAVDSFLRCLDTPPHRQDRVPRYELARCYLRLGKPEEALAQLERLLADHPDDAESWYALGRVHEEQGRAEPARAAWERALSADPDHEPSRAALDR